MSGPQSPYSPKPSEEEWEKAREARRIWEIEQAIKKEDERLKRLSDEAWRKQYQEDLEDAT